MEQISSLKYWKEFLKIVVEIFGGTKRLHYICETKAIKHDNSKNKHNRS
jgi:hypothetical protein